MARLATPCSIFSLSRRFEKYALPWRLLQFGFFLHQPFGMFRRKIAIGIAEHALDAATSSGFVSRVRSAALPGGEAMASHRDRRQSPDGRDDRRWNLFDLWQQALVDLLHVRPRQWASLA